MKTHSELKIQKVKDYQYIVIYYKLGKQMIRLNTKCYYRGKAYHTKDLYYNSKVEDADIMNMRIQTMKMKVDAYLSLELQKINPQISQKECLKYINVYYDNPNFNIDQKDLIIPLFKDFYNYKKMQIGDTWSIKPYKSTLNSLKDFQNHIKKELKPQDIDVEFLYQYRNFLSDEHAPNYLTKGGLNDNTISKRIAAVKTFVRYLQDKDYTIDTKVLTARIVKKYDYDKVVLTKNDLRQLIEFNEFNQFEQKIIDVFVCNCYMGMRWGDLMTMSKGVFEQDEKGNFTYIKLNEKTKTYINIPILQTPKKILKKYDFHLPSYAQQYFNRKLKEIFVKYDLFPEPVNKLNKKLNKLSSETFKKRELISTHCCRRTFITLCIEAKIPLNYIMSATGHTKLETMRKYIKISQNREAFSQIEA